MQPPDVVEPIDVASQHGDELAFASDLAPMRKLGFERMEEALHVGIVLKRFPTLAEVADFAAFVASDRGGATTGAIVNLTCGSLVD